MDLGQNVHVDVSIFEELLLFDGRRSYRFGGRTREVDLKAR